LPLARSAGAAGRELRQYEADLACGQTEQALLQVVRQRQGNRRRAAARRYGDAGDVDIDALDGPGGPGCPAGPGAPSAPGAPSLPSQPNRNRPKRTRDAIRLERMMKLAMVVTPTVC
jgi:hypothetical protein